MVWPGTAGVLGVQTCTSDRRWGPARGTREEPNWFCPLSARCGAWPLTKLRSDYEAGVSPQTAKPQHELVLPFCACQGQSHNSLRKTARKHAHAALFFFGEAWALGFIARFLCVFCIPVALTGASRVHSTGMAGLSRFVRPGAFCREDRFLGSPFPALVARSSRPMCTLPGWPGLRPVLEFLSSIGGRSFSSDIKPAPSASLSPGFQPVGTTQFAC